MKITGFDVQFKPEFGNANHLRIIDLISEYEGVLEKIDEKRKAAVDVLRLVEHADYLKRQLEREILPL